MLVKAIITLCGLALTTGGAVALNTGADGNADLETAPLVVTIDTSAAAQLEADAKSEADGGSGFFEGTARADAQAETGGSANLSVTDDGDQPKKAEKCLDLCSPPGADPDANADADVSIGLTAGDTGAHGDVSADVSSGDDLEVTLDVGVNALLGSIFDC
jgi:hypothetical protein